MDNKVIFADVIKCVDDVEDIELEEAEYDMSELSYDYIFSDVASRDLNVAHDKENIISFYVDRERRTSLEKYVFNVFNEKRRRKISEYDIYRLKERYDNNILEEEIVKAFKGEKSTLENDGGGFIEDKEDEEGIIENGFINAIKTSETINKIENTLVKKITDYGVTENLLVKFNTEIKDLLYDKFQKMLEATNNEIIVNKTMLVDMGNYRELLQNQYATITTPDNKTHRFENEYLRNNDKIIDKPGIGSMLSGDENDLLVDNFWKLYSEHNNELYIDKLSKKLNQDIYSKPILSFNSTVLNKNKLNLNNEQDYFELYKYDINIDYPDDFFNGLYRESSDMTLRDDYLFLLKDVQHLFINEENIELIKTGGKLYKFDVSDFGKTQNKNAHVTEGKVLNKIESTVSIKQEEEFLFHPLDGLYFVETDKWFNYEKTLYQEYSGFMTYGNDKKVYLNDYGKFVGEIDDDFKLYILNHFLISGDDKLGYVEDSSIVVDKFDKGAILNDREMMVGGYGGELDIFSEMMLGKYNKDITLDYGQMLIEKYYHKVVNGFENLFFKVTKRDTDIRIDDIWVHKKIREMYNNTSVIMMNRDRRYIYVNKDISASDTFREIFKYDISTFAYVTSKYINLNATDIFVNTITKGIEEEIYIMQLYKIEKGLLTSLEEVQFDISSYKLNVNSDLMWGNKESDGFEMNEGYSVEASKESRKVVVDDYLFANMPSENNRELNIDYDYTMVGEYPRDIIYDVNGVWINRTVYDASTKDTSYNMHRTTNDINSTNTILGMFKESRRIDTDSKSTHVHKEEKDTFIDFIEEFLHRDFVKEIKFNEELWLGMSYREINNVNNYIVNLEKVNKDVLKNSTEVSIANQRRPIFKLNDNNMFDISEKEMFNNNPMIQFSKEYIKLLEDKHVMVDKINPNISLSENDPKRVSRETYSIINNDNFRWVHKVLRDTYINDVTSAWAGMSDKGAVYYGTELSVDKDTYKASVDSNMTFVGINNKNIYKDYDMLNASKIDYGINSDLGYVGVSKYGRGIYEDKDSIRISKILREINSLSKPITLDKSKAEISNINNYLFVGKLLKEIAKPFQDTLVSKLSGTVDYNENGIFVNNISKGTTINNTWELASRTNISIDIDRDIDFISKQKSNINVEYSGVEVKKNAKDMYIDTFADFIYREFLNGIRVNEDLWIKSKQKSIDNANDYIVNLEKLKAAVHENDTTTRIDRSDKVIFEDNRYNSFGINERELFEEENRVELSKKNISIFENGNLTINKYGYKISPTENNYIFITRELYSIFSKDTFKWVSKIQAKTNTSENTIINGSLEYRNISYLEEMFMLDKIERGTQFNDNSLFLRNNYRSIFINKDVVNAFKDMDCIDIDSEQILASRGSIKVYADNSIVGVSQSPKEIIENDTLIGAAKEQRKLWSEDTHIFIKGEYRNIENMDQSVFIDKTSKGISATQNELFAYKFSKGISTSSNSEFASKFNRNTTVYKDIDFMNKSNMNIHKNSDIDFAYKANLNVAIEDEYYFAYKDNIKTSIDKGYDFLYKLNVGVGEDDNSYNFVDKVKSRVSFDEVINFVDKSSKRAYADHGGITIGKNKKEAQADYDFEFLDRDFSWNGGVRLKGFIFENFFTALGYKNATLTYEHMMLNKAMKNSILQYENLYLSKGRHNQGISYETLFIGKAIHHASFLVSDILISKYIKYMNPLDRYIGISKKVKASSMNYYLEWISKGKKDGAVRDHYTWLSKGNKNTGVNYEFLTADKYNKNTFINYDYVCVDKYIKHTGIVDDNIYISKYVKNGNFNDFLYVGKNYLNAYTPDSLVVKTDYKYTSFELNNNIFISNKDSYLSINEIVLLNQPIKNGHMPDNLSLFKYRSHGKIMEQEFVCKPFLEGFMNESIVLNDIIKDTHIDDDLYIDEYIPNSYIFNNEWANQERKNSNLTQTSEMVEQEIKEFQVEYQNMFVYHVAMDDASKPTVERSGIIDELILPHKDYKYSDYLKDLILPDGRINMRYVKSFDADTGEYTITLPIEHPLNVYTDVGRDYLDVDVAILDMTIHMLKEIWKQKMFRYVAMTAQDSLKDMLMELNKNIKNIYENDPAGKKEAMRCLQLFRWYSEMAILNNCEYILKFYGKQVKVDFVEKDLKEIENLIELNNMHISDNFVLEPIDASKDASVMFTNNQKNLGAPLNISFKLYNVNRNSSISIDDENIENTNYKQGIHDVSIDIKKKAVISFNPNGEYQSMVIANLEATNYSTSNFSVKYKGVFGETNKVMQDLLDRLLVVGEVSDDLKKRLGDIAPVTIAIDKLLTYFELHHNNKEKGKRLITRK